MVQFTINVGKTKNKYKTKRKKELKGNETEYYKKEIMVRVALKSKE